MGGVPWLSVVMPVHRGGDWLDEALSSIPAVSEHGPIAVIIRDSTPEGPCNGPIDRHRSRLMIDYEHMPDIASWTRKTNLGVEAAATAHVCTLHQDDLWLPNRADTIARMILECPDAPLYVTSATIIDSNSTALGHWRPPLAGRLQEPGDYRDRLLVQNFIAMPAPVWRRDTYLKSGGMDEDRWYTPDWDLWLKLAEYGSVVFDPEPTAAFRIHTSSLTMTGSRAEMAQEQNLILTRYQTSNARFSALSRASVEVNSALADAANGKASAALHALIAIARLGPVEALRYLHYSRLAERVLPRLRLRLRGAL